MIRRSFLVTSTPQMNHFTQTLSCATRTTKDTTDSLDAVTLSGFITNKDVSTSQIPFRVFPIIVTSVDVLQDPVSDVIIHA